MDRPCNMLTAMFFGSIVSFSPLVAVAQGTDGPSWAEQKCALYSSAWNDLVGDDAPEGVSDAFLSDHAAFIASGCVERGHVCPRTPRELEIADMLTLMAVAEGMAGSFLPFDCGN